MTSYPASWHLWFAVVSGTRREPVESEPSPPLALGSRSSARIATGSDRCTVQRLPVTPRGNYWLHVRSDGQDKPTVHSVPVCETI